MRNPYAGRSREELVALRRDLLNVRKGHLREGDRLMAEVRRIDVERREAERENVAVSDHAVIRWLERVRGVDTRAVRDEIIAHINEFDRVGDGHIVEGNGVRVCMAENRVTTVLPSITQPRHKEETP